MTRSRLLLSLVSACAGVTALLMASTPASARTTASDPGRTPRSSTTGFDVSWPQCPSSFPGGGAFGIVGVTNGRPWGANPCLSTQYAWAAGLPSAPGFYMNTANPAPHSSFYWPASGSSDPALCKDSTSVADPGCAYDYGWWAADNALTSTVAALSAAGAPSYVATSSAWWLDVETGNSWNGTGSANAADLQGSIDYLRSHGIPSVGLYSTGYQWNAITGGYTTRSAPSYASAWQAEFTSAYGISSSPDWVAGAGSARQAARLCSSSFTGAAVQLTQYPLGGFDADLRC
ncbi:MAG TPA: hypothetical protein VG520_03555 [Candidatus Dormibacteraeota bacterium]|nr:hypothetical protein [Candidatus Dormibacteraeota bacterium]